MSHVTASTVYLHVKTFNVWHHDATGPIVVSYILSPDHRAVVVCESFEV